MFDPKSMDGQAILARLRAGDEAEIVRAFIRTFGSPEGRFVLLLILKEGGVGALRGPELGGKTRAYHDGRADLAREIANRAGFDEDMLALAQLTETLEGPEDERAEHPDPKL